MTNVMPELREEYTMNFATAKGNWDMFVIFIEQGLNLCNKKGIYSFIIPNKLIAAKYSETLRKELQKTTLLEIRDYSRLPVFSNAAVYPCTIVGCKENIESNNRKFIIMNNLSEYSIQNTIEYSFFQKYTYWDLFFVNEFELSIINKFLRHPLLKEKFDVIGAATVSEAYEIKEVIQDKAELNNSFKIVNTGTIDPYSSLWGLKQMQYIKDKYFFPRIEKESLLKINKNRIIQASSEKIIVAGMSSRIEAIYDIGETLGGKSTTIILGANIKFLLGIINSKLISFSINILYNSMKMAGGYLNIGTRELESLSIPSVSKEQQQLIINLVDKILATKKGNPQADTSALEHQIDLLVYHLYGLTYEEAQIIDNNLTEEEFNTTLI